MERHSTFTMPLYMLREIAGILQDESDEKYYVRSREILKLLGLSCLKDLIEQEQQLGVNDRLYAYAAEAVTKALSNHSPEFDAEAKGLAYKHALDDGDDIRNFKIDSLTLQVLQYHNINPVSLALFCQMHEDTVFMMRDSDKIYTAGHTYATLTENKISHDKDFLYFIYSMDEEKGDIIVSPGVIGIKFNIPECVKENAIGKDISTIIDHPFFMEKSYKITKIGEQDIRIDLAGHVHDGWNTKNSNGNKIPWH